MFKLTANLAICLVFFLCSSAKANNSQICMQEVAVEINNLLPLISINFKAEKRLGHISIKMPIDCETGIYLRPVTLEQAVEWLDKALPLNYKVGLLKGNTFLHSPYGSSVDEDLTDFLQKQWMLTKRNSVCKDAMSRMNDHDEMQLLMDDEDVIYCGPDLFNTLKDSYLLGPE